MERIDNPKKFQEICQSWRSRGLVTALVPTMGFFHEGHLSLMSYARSLADKVAVSLFVNPTQFGPAEDLSRYPRALERDAGLAAARGVDVLFTPEASSMYSPDHGTWIEVPELSQGLCGTSRPGHFRGVCTVVAKLFMLAQPNFAVFGEKDWQQLAVIRRMARDLNIPVEIVGRPTVREADGLAMSSRNVNLTPEERQAAPAIRKGLQEARRQVAEGETDAASVVARLKDFYAANLPMARIDYVALVHPATLRPLDEVAGPALLAVALHMSRARLIDNILVGV